MKAIVFTCPMPMYPNKWFILLLLLPFLTSLLLLFFNERKSILNRNNTITSGYTIFLLTKNTFVEMHVIFNSIPFVCLVTSKNKKVNALKVPCLVRNFGFYYDNTMVIIIFYCYSLNISTQKLDRHCLEIRCRKVFFLSFVYKYAWTNFLL